MMQHRTDVGYNQDFWVHQQTSAALPCTRCCNLRSSPREFGVVVETLRLSDAEQLDGALGAARFWGCASGPFQIELPIIVSIMYPHAVV